MTFFMVLVFRLFIGVYKFVLLKPRYCFDLVMGFVIFIRWQNSVFGTYRTDQTFKLSQVSQLVHCLTRGTMGHSAITY